MKISKLFLILLFSTNTHASGGFTWISSLSHTLDLGLPEHVLTFMLVGVFLIFIGLLYRQSLSKTKNVLIPDRGISLRNLIEAYGQFIMNQCKAVIGEERGPQYFSFIATIFIVVLCSNLIGLIPGFLPPTEHISTTFAIGILSFLYYNAKGCKELGVINYLKHFAGPLWYMAILIFPIEIISNCIRPISLALRLRGNMYGDHLVLGIFSQLVPFAVPIVFLLLGLMVCVIQAYVFTILSMVYIGLATAHQDHGEHAHH